MRSDGSLTKAIAVATSDGEEPERAFLDTPKAEWLWEDAQASDLLVHVHPPMASIGAEPLMQYRLGGLQNIPTVRSLRRRHLEPRG